MTQGFELVSYCQVTAENNQYASNTAASQALLPTGTEGARSASPTSVQPSIGRDTGES